MLYAPLATNDKTGDANGLSVIVNKDSIDVRLRGVPLLEQATKHGLRNDRYDDTYVLFELGERATLTVLDANES